MVQLFHHVLDANAFNTGIACVLNHAFSYLALAALFPPTRAKKEEGRQAGRRLRDEDKKPEEETGG